MALADDKQRNVLPSLSHLSFSSALPSIGMQAANGSEELKPLPALETTAIFGPAFEKKREVLQKIARKYESMEVVSIRKRYTPGSTVYGVVFDLKITLRGKVEHEKVFLLKNAVYASFVLRDGQRTPNIHIYERDAGEQIYANTINETEDGTYFMNPLYDDVIGKYSAFVSDAVSFFRDNQPAFLQTYELVFAGQDESQPQQRDYMVTLTGSEDEIRAYAPQRNISSFRIKTGGTVEEANL